MAEAKRDQNQIVTLMGVTDDGNLTPVNLVVDPTTGRLKVSAVISTGSLTSLNGLSAATQLFAVGTTGDDFNIASLTATHTFNLPTASATKRGALSSADWTTFNSKAPALGADDNYVTDAEKTKIGYISVTQAVDLDTIESRVNALDAAVVLKGAWDASAGTFPGAGAAQAGDSYIVSVAGTVDGIAFSINDRLLAILDNASTTVYATNWLKLDYTDQVLSVAGRTGAVTLAIADLTDAGNLAEYAAVNPTAAGLAILDDATAADQRTTLGLGTGDSPQFTALEVGHATDSTITRVSAGVLAIEGNNIITSATVPVKATKAEAAASTDDAKFLTALSAAGLWAIPEGWILNGKISVTVSANDLIVALKGKDGNDPSATNPVYAMIGGSLRTVTAALSVTAADGTSWCNSGSVELGTKEIDYFVYLGYNATDGVVIGFSRIPYARSYDDFSATTTNEKFCKISTITTAAATDYYNVIGRFAATLSLTGTGHLWTVPTYTAKNLIQTPIYETRWLDYVPTITSGSGTPTTVTKNDNTYLVRGRQVFVNADNTVTDKGTANSVFYVTVPFTEGSGGHSSFAGRENGVTGNTFSGYLETATLNAFLYTNGTLWVNSYRVPISINYEV